MSNLAIVFLVIFLCLICLIWSVAASNRNERRDKEEREQKAKQKLQNELTLPRKVVQVTLSPELGGVVKSSKPFEPFLHDFYMIVTSSSELAQASIDKSFERGYFSDQESNNYPVCQIASVKIVEA